jgi:hypothetical protein
LLIKKPGIARLSSSCLVGWHLLMDNVPQVIMMRCADTYEFRAGLIVVAVHGF